MHLSDFSIRQLVFEVRYADSFIIWDCAGRITKELARLWPGTTIQEVTPNQQGLQNEVVSLVTGLNSSRLVLAKPKTILQYSDQISQTLKIWTDHLDITELTRVGTRLFYERRYDSEDAASKAVMDLGLIRYPEEPFFNHRSAPYAGDIRLLWREAESQTQIVIKPERHQIEIAGLNGNPGEKETRTFDCVLLDIDRATRGVVDLAKFRVPDWLSGVRHLVSRDIPKLMNQS